MSRKKLLNIKLLLINFCLLFWFSMHLILCFFNFQTLIGHCDLIQIVSIFGISNSGLIGGKHLNLMYLISLFIWCRELKKVAWWEKSIWLMYKLFYIFSFYGYYIKLLNLIIVITKYEIFPFFSHQHGTCPNTEKEKRH